MRRPVIGHLSPGGRASTVALALGLICASWLGALDVRFVNPPPKTAVFDRVEVEVEVIGDEKVTAVEFHVDGRAVGRLTQPPYRLGVDVGSENRAHRFEVVVFGVGGELARAERKTDALLIHDHVKLELQQIYVTVTRRNGQRVLDLEAEDFTVRDSGEPQEIVTFERGDIPFTAILLVDTSETMRGAKLTAALQGVETFARGMATHDEARLMLFSDRLLASSEFTSDASRLVEGLEEVEAAGGTAVNDFLFLALRQLDSRQGRRVVVVLSDGSDVHSLLEMSQVRDVARRSQAQIFWVRLGEDRRSSYNSWRDQEGKERQIKEFVQTVAESGGRRLRVDGAEQIEEAFQEILQELRQQYALGYYPERQAVGRNGVEQDRVEQDRVERDRVERNRDGRWRPLEVEVGRRRLEVRTQGGYHDD